MNGSIIFDDEKLTFIDLLDRSFSLNEAKAIDGHEAKLCSAENVIHFSKNHSSASGSHIEQRTNSVNVIWHSRQKPINKSICFCVHNFIGPQRKKKQ